MSQLTSQGVHSFEDEARREMLKRCEHPPGEGRVYCIINFERNAAKIGTTRNVRKRLQQLQTASPDALYLHEQIRGGKTKERELHRRYAKHRLTGEWFDLGASDIAGEFAVFSVDDDLEALRRHQRGLV